MITLSRTDLNGNQIYYYDTTANCYIIKSCGKYKFPLVYGNALVDGKPNPAAYTRKGEEKNTQPFYDAYDKEITNPWIEGCVSGEVVGNDSPDDYVVENIKVSEGYMEFEVKKFPTLGGNIILAVKDEEGDILWSWHLWAYADELTVINGFLNVNLGWKWDDESKTSGTNPHYQWGRKDPMLGNCSVSEYCVESLGETIRNPNMFFTCKGYNCSWWRRDDKAVNFFNYWNADVDKVVDYDEEMIDVIKTIYDPCPVGYQVPKGDEFDDFNISNGGEWNGGFTWKERYFPAAGYCNYTSGDIRGVGSGGYYWSSTSECRMYAYCLYLYSTYVFPRDSYCRAFGFSVVPFTNTLFANNNKNIKEEKHMDISEKVNKVLESITNVLLEKNKRYGNSALEPIHVFYKGDAENSILIRLDDKLSRIRNSNELRENDVFDMLGYLFLLKINNDRGSCRTKGFDELVSDVVVEIKATIRDMINEQEELSEKSFFAKSEQCVNLIGNNHFILRSIDDYLIPKIKEADYYDNRLIINFMVYIVLYFVNSDKIDFSYLID